MQTERAWPRADPNLEPPHQKTELMKTSLLLTAAFAFSLTASATVLTVSNDPNSPAQYDEIGHALYYANPNDTILISGGVYTNTNIVNMPLTIIGNGTFANYSSPTTASFKLTAGADGSRIIGINFDPLLFGPFEILDASNIYISRVTAGYISCEDAGNITIVHSKFNGATFFNCQDVILRNSIISDDIFYNNTSILISNNMITASSINNDGNAVYSNNVFYNFGNFLLGTPGLFNNNLMYGSSFTLPPAGSSGSGNINQQDPLFVSFTNTMNSDSIFHVNDLHLQTGSPAQNAGTDGLDLGIYGGSDPMPETAPYQVMGKPRLPEVIEYNVLAPTSVPQNGTLNIEVKAVKND